MSRKQIGLRMKDETRDQLERVRGGLSRTDYIEGAVLAQIARDLKRVETPHEYSLDTGGPVCSVHSNTMPCPFCVTSLDDGKPVQKIDMVEDGPAGPMFVWLCGLCGQPLNQWEKCNSGIHVGPNETGSQGTPVKSTILAALLRQSKFREGELQDGSRIEDGEVYPQPLIERRDGSADMERCIEAQIEAQKNRPLNQQIKALKENPPSNGFAVRSSAESRAGVVPVPKKAQKGRR